MYGVIATCKVKEDKIAEFEAVVAALGAAVAKDEPENRGYNVFKVRNAPGPYKILEVYASKDGFKAHVAAAHFQAAQPKMEATFAEPMAVELMEGV